MLRNLKARLLAALASFLLAALRRLVGHRLDIHVVPKNYSTAPRAQRRALGKLIAKGVTRGVPGGARLKTKEK